MLKQSFMMELALKVKLGVAPSMCRAVAVVLYQVEERINVQHVISDVHSVLPSSKLIGASAPSCSVFYVGQMDKVFSFSLWCTAMSDVLVNLFDLKCRMYENKTRVQSKNDCQLVTCCAMRFRYTAVQCIKAHL